MRAEGSVLATLKEKGCRDFRELEPNVAWVSPYPHVAVPFNS